MRRALALFAFLFVSPFVAAVFAEEAPEAAPPVKEAPIISESEIAQQWKELQAQEQWVARLNKQIKGETKQLSEMRLAFAKKFKLDPKKFEAGSYTYDPKTDTVVDKSTIANEAKQSNPEISAAKLADPL